MLKEERLIVLASLPKCAVSHEIGNLQFQLFLIRYTKRYYHQLSFFLLLGLVWLAVVGIFLLQKKERGNLEGRELYTRTLKIQVELEVKVT